MNKRSRIQGYLFKLGFVLFICIPQSQTFGFSLLDFKQLPFRNNIELVSNKKSDLKRKNLDYFSYKQYLSDLFDASDKIISQQFYCKEFIKLYNTGIKVRLDQNHRVFNYEITPIINKNKGLKINHLLKIETLTYSA